MTTKGLTPSQTVGPFFHYGLTPWAGAYPVAVTADGMMVTEATTGTRIRVTGQVFDGAGDPVPDCMIEVWQADSTGRFTTTGNAAFAGFGRSDTDATGTYRFDTILPGAVAGPGGRMQAPHLLLAVFGRGMLTHLYTRIYFPAHPSNADDPVLQLVPEARRATLIASATGPGSYSHDIRLQGDGETVFFDL